MMKFRILLVLGAFASSFAALAQVPQLVSYQGRIAVGPANFNGPGQFKFALVDPTGATSYWTNDGTHLDGTEPTAAVPLTVSKGLYSVLLGDVSANMTAIPASVWSNPDVRLRVWFNDGVNNSQLLSPDQRLAPNAYLSDGSVTAPAIADATITGGKIAAGAVTGINVAPSSLDFSLFAVPAAPNIGQVLGFNGNSLTWTAPGGADGIWTLAGGNAYRSTGTVGIGGLPGASTLQVTGSNALTMSGSQPYLNWNDTNSGKTSAISNANGTLYFRMPQSGGPGIVTAAYVDGTGLTVNGVANIATGGSGGVINFGTPNSETGFSINGANRADYRFNGSVLKILVGPVGGPPPAFNGIAITPDGKVGIGTGGANNGQLDVIGSGSVNAIQGLGAAGDGVYGTSASGAGINGFSSNVVGVFAQSFSGFGLKAFATSGTAIYGHATTGLSLNVDGSARQTRQFGGLAKALLYVRADGTILRGYNSFLDGSAATTPPCGFGVALVKGGINNNSIYGYVIDFGFRIDDRFASVTPSPGQGGITYGSNSQGPDPNKIWITLLNGADFTVIIY